MQNYLNQFSTTQILAGAAIGLSIPFILHYYLKKQPKYPNVIDFKSKIFNENYEECLLIGQLNIQMDAL